MAFSIIVFERIPNKWVKEDSVGVLLGVLLKYCNILFFIISYEYAYFDSYASPPTKGRKMS